MHHDNNVVSERCHGFKWHTNSPRSCEGLIDCQLSVSLLDWHVKHDFRCNGVSPLWQLNRQGDRPCFHCEDGLLIVLLSRHKRCKQVSYWNYLSSRTSLVKWLSPHFVMLNIMIFNTIIIKCQVHPRTRVLTVRWSALLTRSHRV